MEKVENSLLNGLKLDLKLRILNGSTSLKRMLRLVQQQDASVTLRCLMTNNNTNLMGLILLGQSHQHSVSSCMKYTLLFDNVSSCMQHVILLTSHTFILTKPVSSFKDFYSYGYSLKQERCVFSQCKPELCEKLFQAFIKCFSTFLGISKTFMIRSCHYYNYRRSIFHKEVQL